MRTRTKMILIFAISLVMTLSTNTWAQNLDLKGLTPKSKDKLAQYIQACELTKKDNETLGKAHATCTQELNQGQSAGTIVFVGIVSLLLGGLVGSSLRGN
jgi:hypothetical protein